MHLRNNESSTAVAEEVFLGLGAEAGFDYIEYPKKGTWRGDVLSFHDCKITEIIMKRPETASFPVIALFGNHKLTGEIICDLSDGTPAITVDGDKLRFQFDPFGMHLANLNEWFQRSKTDALRRSALVMYSNMPPNLKRSLRWLARHYKTANIRSLKDIRLLGVSSNVIIHLIEQQLRERGLVELRHRQPFAAITHDIDTDFCQAQGREILSSVENNEGVYATWFFVPQPVQYSLNRGGVQSLMEEGHEIGMHGYAHDGKLALDNPAKLIKQIRKGKNILESTGVKVTSFRSPWALRSSSLLLALASQSFKVDSSYPDVDTLGMTGGRKGLLYNRPFRPLIMKRNSLLKPLPLWEVPMTGPQDVQMIEDLKLTGNDLLKVWNLKAEFCKDFGGVFVLHTHPKDIVKHLKQYVEILRVLKRSGFRIMRLDSLVKELQANLGL